MSELFPVTAEELVVWKLEYADSIPEWKHVVYTVKTYDPADYINPEAQVVKWLIDLERAVPTAVRYLPAAQCQEDNIHMEDIAFESMAVYVAGQYVNLMTDRFYEQVVNHRVRLAQGDDAIAIEC